MIKINTESNGYSVVADMLATFIGAGASMIVGSVCNGIIGVNNDAGFGKTTAMKAGKIGLETLTIYSIAPRMRNEIDDLADLYNHVADVVNDYKESHPDNTVEA